MQSLATFSVLLLLVPTRLHIHGLTTTSTRSKSYSDEDLYSIADSQNSVGESRADNINQNLRKDGATWIPPITVWSKLHFPAFPEQGLDNRNSKPVPEAFDANKLNVNISADGFVVGHKFCQCGRRPWRRTEAPDLSLSNDIPWNMILTLNSPSPLVFCGGTLLNDLYVVTAAHCVDRLTAENISVRLSEEELLPSSSTIYQTHKYDVEEVILHSKYNPRTVEHDIALLKLSEAIDFFEVPVSPACLPVTNENYHSKYNGTVTRWVSVLDSRGNDSSNMLQKTDLPLISISQCSRQNKYSGLISENHICTKSCQGDSGGGLIIERNERKHLVGIGSWGLECMEDYSPSVYTRVAKYAAWILQNSKTAEWCIE